MIEIVGNSHYLTKIMWNEEQGKLRQNKVENILNLKFTLSFVI